MSRFSIPLMCAAVFASAEGRADALAVQEVQQTVRIPGTRVTFTISKEFGVAGEFAGLVHAGSRSSVLVDTIPRPYKEVAAGFCDPEVLKREGMVELAREDRPMGKFPGFYLEVDKEEGRTKVKKCFWVFGSKRRTVMVMGNCFQVFAEDSFPMVRTVVESARWDPSLAIDPFEGMPFKLGDEGGLKFFARMGNALSFTVDGDPDEAGMGKPILNVGPALSSGNIERRGVFARQRVKDVAGVKELVIESHERLKIDKLNGFETIAVAKDTKTNLPVLIYQVILFETTNYWLMQGLCRQEDRENWVANFRRLAHSLERTAALPTMPTRPRRRGGR